MTETESRTVAEIKQIHQKLTEYSEHAQLNQYLDYFDKSKDFIQVGSDGIRRNFEELQTACTGYYQSLKHQTITTIDEKFHVLSDNLLLLCWTGNILAEFKNGDSMKMNNYSITNVFRKKDGRWKIIHSHESSLPPEILKKQV